MVFPNLRYAIPFACGVLFALLLTPIARRAAFWLGALDQPGERRIHSVPMPRFGGIVIYFALALSLAPVVFIDVFVDRLFLGRTETTVLIVSATTVLAIGILDDCRSVPPWIKLVVETIAAALVVSVGFSIRTIFHFELGWLTVPVSILWIVTVINGVNLIDGLDGLAVGASLISSATLFAVSLYLRDVSTALILAALCGTLVGFLYYNFHPARLFLGDSGALLIGFLIAVIAIQSSSKSATVVAVLAPAIAVGLPLSEVILTTVRRMLRVIRTEDSEARDSSFGLPNLRRSALFTADREHIHHRLLALGITHRTAVILLYGVCLSFGVLAFVLCFQRIDIVLILAGAAAAAGALIPRLDHRSTMADEIGTDRMPFEDLLGKNRALPYVFLDSGLAILAWLGALLYNRSSAGPALAHINEAGPWVILAQVTILLVAGTYRRGGNRYAGIHDLLALLKPLVAAAIGTGVVLWVFQRGMFVPVRILAVDTYLLATLVCGSRFVLRILEYLVNADVSRRSLPGEEPTRPPEKVAGLS